MFTDRSSWSVMTDSLPECSSSRVFPLSRLKLRHQCRTDDSSITLSPYTSFNWWRISWGWTFRALRNLIVALTLRLARFLICLNIINGHRRHTGKTQCCTMCHCRGLNLPSSYLSRQRVMRHWWVPLSGWPSYISFVWISDRSVGEVIIW